MELEIIKIMPIPYRNDKNMIEKILKYCENNNIELKDVPSAIFKKEHIDFFKEVVMASLHLGMKIVYIKNNKLCVE